MFVPGRSYSSYQLLFCHTFHRSLGELSKELAPGWLIYSSMLVHNLGEPSCELFPTLCRNAYDDVLRITDVHLCDASNSEAA